MSRSVGGARSAHPERSLHFACTARALSEFPAARARLTGLTKRCLVLITFDCVLNALTHFQAPNFEEICNCDAQCALPVKSNKYKARSLYRLI